MTMASRKTAAFSFIAILALALCAGAHSRKIRTRIPVSAERGRTENTGRSGRGTNAFETTDTAAAFASVRDCVRFYGFDKTSGSSSESFFVVNGLGCGITGMKVEITYLDMKGRQLHRREAEFDCDIPAGETRRQDIRTWDIQKAFHFHKSAQPRRQSTPFDVKIRLKGLSTDTVPLLPADKPVID